MDPVAGSNDMRACLRDRAMRSRSSPGWKVSGADEWQIDVSCCPAVVLGLGAMVATRLFMSRPAVPRRKRKRSLVAARDFKEEEILKPDMVTLIRMAKKAVPAGAFSSFKDVEDRWVKTTMLEGDPIVEKKLGPKGTPPGLVANIPQGMRAFADRGERAVGRLRLHPSGTSRRRDPVRANDENASSTSETILQNMLVSRPARSSPGRMRKRLQNRTVTLAVTPEQVDILVAARAKGPLSLSLRGVNDHDIVVRAQAKPELNDEEGQQQTQA